MRNTILLFSACLLALTAHAQNSETAQLQQALKQHPQPDTTRVNLLNTLARLNTLQPDELEKLANEALTLSKKTGYARGSGYALLNLSRAKQRQGDRAQAVLFTQQADSVAKNIDDPELHIYVLLNKSQNATGTDNQKALVYAKAAEEIALKTGDKKLVSISQNQVGGIYGSSLNNYPLAIEYSLKSVRSGEEANCLPCLLRSWANLGGFYSQVGDQANSLLYYQKAADANKRLGNKFQEVQLNNNIGERYRVMGKYKEAIPYYEHVLADAKDPLIIEMAESNLADVYTRMDSLTLAFKYAFSSLAKARKIDDNEGVAWIDGILSRLYLKKGLVDSALYYSNEGFNMARQVGSVEFMRDNAGALANAYAFKKDFKNAYNYHLQYIKLRDSIQNSEISNKSALLQYNYDLAKKQAQITTLDQQKKVQRNYLIGALIVLAFIVATAAVLLRNNRLKQRANQLLQKQKLELQDQRDQTNKALAELQLAQRQLIQSEKMASLGELTAGIAHEIQNPLNFVNNFSETNTELLEEMKQEIEKGNMGEAKAIASNVIENNTKITNHGKRADAIVKGMLQHSRASGGKKELADINALIDEYLRLSYHGLRAKDKTFNATLETGFDKNIDKINIVPQDIGRVLFNLFNNAFYAVHEKTKKFGRDFKPTVSVRTKKQADKVEIEVKDNGMGISKSVQDKIFQPFFTTKPAGQGTGLGLSLSYDIVKAHGGELKVESTDGEGSVFIITIPKT